MQINGSSINASAINGSSRVRKILFDGEVNVDFISNSTLIKFSNFEASSDSELHSFGETYKKAHINSNVEINILNQLDPIKKVFSTAEFITSSYVSASPTIFKFGDGLAITANHLSLSSSLNDLSGISVCEPSVCDLDLIKTINFEASFDSNILTGCEFRRKKRIEGNSSYTFESNLIPTKSIKAFGDCYIEVVPDFKALFKKILVGQSDCQLIAKLNLSKKTTFESILVLAISSELKSILNINSEDIESQKFYKINIKRYLYKCEIIREIDKQFLDKMFLKGSINKQLCP